MSGHTQRPHAVTGKSFTGAPSGSVIHIHIIREIVWVKGLFSIFIHRWSLPYQLNSNKGRYSDFSNEGPYF